MIDKLWGTLVALGVVGRTMLRKPPRPVSMPERLAAMPADAPLAAPLTIHWDEHQIPFIEAQSDRDLAVGLGLVHAHLRLGQIEIMRRVALGRVAEMIAPWASRWTAASACWSWAARCRQSSTPCRRRPATGPKASSRVTIITSPRSPNCRPNSPSWASRASPGAWSTCSPMPG
ncbi:hypothetical protein D3874_15780 [Oleomonas cavernae]|uniref:Uncharacterized protein n=1 Tax=Oleomonas cavernae TaxID=2320859 RepID=A0A418WEB9_9PROT|nr:hypothetical protein D3874_15780 [Oleomonas cavernae]